MGRREFLKTLGVIGATQFFDTSTPLSSSILDEFAGKFQPNKDFLNKFLPNKADTEITEFGKYSILQGVTDQTRTQINVVVPRVSQFSYRLRDTRTGAAIDPDYADRTTWESSAWVVENVGFSNLHLGRRYVFDVIEQDGRVVDRREVFTLDLDDRTQRFAFISCFDDKGSQKSRDEMWDSLQAENPGQVFLIGDNVYAAPGTSTVDADTIWNRYVKARNQDVKFYKQKRLTPTIAVWDDHDYGSNDGDHTYKYKYEAKIIFNAFFPRREMPGVFEHGPGVSSWFEAFGMHFQLMDGRFYKGLPGIWNSESQWGLEQEQWLFRSLDRSKYPIMLINGTQFFDTFSMGENFQKEFPENHEAIMRELAKNPFPVTFVSGDVHFSEINEIPAEILGYRTYEVTSSGMSKFRVPLIPIPLPINSWRINGVFKNAFTLVRNVAQSGGVSLIDVTAYGKEQKIFYTRGLVARKPLPA